MTERLARGARRLLGAGAVGAALLLAPNLTPGDVVPTSPSDARSQGAESSSGAARAVAVLRAIPKPGRVAIGGVVTVVITARDLRDAGSVAFHLVYDPSKVQPLPGSFAEGGLLRRGGVSTSFLARAASTGDRIIVGLARLGAPRGARGAGTICRLAFRAVSSGATSFALDRARVGDPDAKSLPARVVPATIQISARAAGGGGGDAP